MNEEVHATDCVLECADDWIKMTKKKWRKRKNDNSQMHCNIVQSNVSHAVYSLRHYVCLHVANEAKGMQTTTTK